MNEKEIKQTAKDWYTLGRNFLPEFDTQAFARLAGQSHALVYDTAGSAKEILLTVDPKAETAYVDLHENKIAIPAKYFSQDLYTSRFGDSGADNTEALAIALINGAMIHEALHIKYTAKGGPVTIPEAIGLTSSGIATAKKYGMHNAAVAFNIIEDLFIEANTPENLMPWIQACSDIHFDRKDLDREWDLAQIDDFMNLAICWKNQANRDHEAFDNFSELQLALLNRAVDEEFAHSSLRRRVQLAMEFLNTFVIPDPDNPDESESGEGDPDEGEGEGEPKEGKGEEKTEGKTEEKTTSGASKGKGEIDPTDADPSTGKTMGDALEDTENPSDETIEEIDREVKEASEEIAKDESDSEAETIGGYEIRWKKLEESDILKTSTGLHPRVDPVTEINFTFLKNLQAIRTANRTPGAARKSGSVMVKSRLTRIATDSKIFAKNDSQRNTLKRIEVIINVDFSASTTGAVIDNELGAAKAMSQILRAAGIAHSVYGHTSSYPDDTPILFHIFSFDMATTNHDFEARFKKACLVRLSQNYDGVVIKRLGERFTNRNGKRFLINLSDGIPEGPGYTGRPACTHTKREIQSLRDKGIAVFAISVVDRVVESNDAIYGKDFNIDGSRNTNAQFQRLIEKIATG